MIGDQPSGLQNGVFRDDVGLSQADVIALLNLYVNVGEGQIAFGELPVSPADSSVIGDDTLQFDLADGRVDIGPIETTIRPDTETVLRLFRDTAASLVVRDTTNNVEAYMAATNSLGAIYGAATAHQVTLRPGATRAVLTNTGRFGVGANIVPDAQLHIQQSVSETADQTEMLKNVIESTGTPAGNFGFEVNDYLENKLGAETLASQLQVFWTDASTDVSVRQQRAAEHRFGGLGTNNNIFTVLGGNGNTVMNMGGTNDSIGFLGATAVTRRGVDSGSGTLAADILQALIDLGLCFDSAP